MDISQRIKETQAELEAAVNKANELTTQGKAFLQQASMVQQEVFRLQGSLNTLIELQEEQEKGSKPK